MSVNIEIKLLIVLITGESSWTFCKWQYLQCQLKIGMLMLRELFVHKNHRTGSLCPLLSQGLQKAEAMRYWGLCAWTTSPVNYCAAVDKVILLWVLHGSDRWQNHLQVVIHVICCSHSLHKSLRALLVGTTWGQPGFHLGSRGVCVLLKCLG